jgi:hypothetical protein
MAYCVKAPSQGIPDECGSHHTMCVVLEKFAKWCAGWLLMLQQVLYAPDSGSTWANEQVAAESV